MIAIIFEVTPAEGRKAGYLDYAARLRSELERMDGFVSVERFQSLANPGKLLSPSYWRAEAARIARRRPPDATESFAIIACASRLSFATMEGASAASRRRPIPGRSTACD